MPSYYYHHADIVAQGYLGGHYRSTNMDSFGTDCGYIVDDTPINEGGVDLAYSGLGTITIPACVGNRVAYTYLLPDSAFPTSGLTDAATVYGIIVACMDEGTNSMQVAGEIKGLPINKGWVLKL